MLGLELKHNSNAFFFLFSNCEVLTTLTPDAGKILSKLHAVQPRGTINFCTGIRVAHVRPTLEHAQKLTKALQ